MDLMDDNIRFRSMRTNVKRILSTFSLGFVSRNAAIFRLINETDRRAGIEIRVLLFPPTISTIVRPSPNDFRVSPKAENRG